LQVGPFQRLLMPRSRFQARLKCGILPKELEVTNAVNPDNR